MNIFFTITTIAFFLWAARSILFWVGLWQDKEYRFDRLRVHIQETIQGRHIIFSWGNLIKWLLLLLYIVVIFYERWTERYEIGIGIFYIFQATVIVFDIYKHRIKRPTFTAKAKIISLGSMLLVIALFFLPILNVFVWTIFVDRLIPLIVGILVFFLAFPTEIYRDIRIQQAKRKLKKYKDLLIIAVSGSYGKTSTKEYIAQILSKKYHVVKTPASNNTPIGIAQTILTQITSQTDIFVVEMGAYKKGEIADLCKIVRPSISVTTSISDQHISLYGNMENVLESEYELVHALPKDGLALFNGNNGNIHELITRTKRKKIIYQWFTKKPTKKITIGAYNIHPTPIGTKFTAIVNGQELACTTLLVGIHVIENILPAIYLGSLLGIEKNTLVEAVAHLTPPAKTLQRVTLKHGSIAVDDTFNASPESVFSALEYIALYEKQKFCVLGPLTELGKHAKERHIQIGEKVGKICDYLYVINRNYYKELQKGIQNVEGKCILLVARPEEVAIHIREKMHPSDVILFEGKESGMVLKKLL